jgi:hypothetical protein
LMDINDFLAHYGERGRMLLRAIYEEAVYPSSEGKLGDFSFKSIKKRLSSYGLSYNPSPLLRILEREVGLIETSYKSSNQHWWKITDLNLLKTAIGASEPLSDPKIRLLRIQFYSLDPLGILEYLEKLIKKKRILESDKRKFKKVVFEVLPGIVNFLEESEDYDEDLTIEREIANRILDLAETVSFKITGSIIRSNLGSFEFKGSIRESSESIPDKSYRL